MIELAAKFWKCSLHDTVARLEHEGLHFPDGRATAHAVNMYADLHVGRRQRCQNLLETARKRMADGSVPVERLIHRLGLRQEQQRQDWAARMGRFMGAANLHVVRGTFVRFKNPKQRGGNPLSQMQLFRGVGWKDVLVIPFHDLPDRFAGFLFIGRQARKQDYAFKIVDEVRGNSSGRRAEIGVCMYDVLTGPTDRQDWFRNDVFVMADPVVALKLQSRHMRDSALPLPVVGTYNKLLPRGKSQDWELVTYQLWNTLPGRRFIFWGPILSGNLFNMAARADGLVCISPVPTNMGRESSAGWLRRLQRKARHWTEVLETSLRTLPEESAVKLLSNLDLSSDVMRMFVDGCGDIAKQRIQNYRHRIESLCRVTINGHDVVESALGWSLQSTDECISNAILRIEKIVCRPDAPDNEPQCKGQIIFKGQSSAFTTRMDALEKHTARWLKREVLNRFDELPLVKRNWSPHLIELSRQFHTPLVVREDGRFGWKPHDSHFALPQFVVNLGGDVVAEEASVIDSMAPGQTLQPPDALPNAAAVLLEHTPANQLFWATAACLGANILAPAAGQQIAGLGLIGHGGIMVGKGTARAFGCCEYSAVGRQLAYGEREARRIEQVLITHNWPMMVMRGAGASRTILDAWINGHYSHNAVLCTDAYRADLLATLDAWRFVAKSDPIEISPAIQLYGPLILPLWLQRLCGQKLTLQSHEDAYVLRVLDDLAHMMAPYGSTDIIHKAAAIIDDATSPADRGHRFVSLMYHLIADGILPFHPGALAKKQKIPAILRIADERRAPGIFVPREAVTYGLLRKSISIPDPGRVTDALRSANALDCECKYNGDVGWFIVEQWWSRQIERCRARHQCHLKVIGGHDEC